jgi:hypothetical protein
VNARVAAVSLNQREISAKAFLARRDANTGVCSKTATINSDHKHEHLRKLI